MNQQRLDELLEGLCADTLNAEEQAELDALIAEVPEAARQVALICDLTRAVRDHLRPTSQRLPTAPALAVPPRTGPQASTRPAPRRAAPRPRRPHTSMTLPVVLSGAAALVVVAVLFGRPGTPERWLEGQATYAAGGQVVPGLPVPTDAPVVVAGTATLCFADGTRVRLGDGTRLTVSGGPGKQLHLDQGRLDARVAKQPEGAPFQVRTAHTRVTVIGTVFTLAVAGTRTELSVDEGAVRLAAAGVESVVSAGQKRTVDAAGGPAVLIPRSAVWAYRDLGEPPEDGWLLAGFDERAWPRGSAPLGYDRDEQRTVFATHLRSEKAARITTWFRHEFTCEDPAQVTRLVLDLQRDDGVVVYLNGREVVRDNLPAGDLTAQTLALDKIDGKRRDEHLTFAVATSALRSGRNCIAAQVHQDSTGSTDLLFSLELRAEYQPPATTP